MIINSNNTFQNKLLCHLDIMPQNSILKRVFRYNAKGTRKQRLSTKDGRNNFNLCSWGVDMILIMLICSVIVIRSDLRTTGAHVT